MIEGGNRSPWEAAVATRIKARAIFAAAIVTTLIGCATAPPCTPMGLTPPPKPRANSTECLGDGDSLTGPSAVVRYAASSTDSIRHPDRIISGPHTGLCGPSAVATGPKGELYVLNHAPWHSPVTSNENRRMHWVTVYDSAASGDAKPLRTLQVRTRGFMRPMSLGVNRDGYVYLGFGMNPRLRFGSVTVFAADADGDAPPIRVLVGPDNGLRGPDALAVDRQGYLYVANAQNREADDTVRVFAPGADGDASACRVIAGPRTGLSRPSALAIDGKDHLYVGNWSGPGSSHSPSSITVFDTSATGDVAPIRTLEGGNTADGSQWPHRLAFGRDDSLYVRTAGVLSVYAPGATEATEPVRYISRTVRGEQYPIIYSPKIFALDRHDTMYVVRGDTVMVYAPGYSGSEPAIRRITGPRSGIHEVTSIAIDNRGWLYLVQRQSFLIQAYAPGASGDVPPSRTIAGPWTQLNYPTGGIAVDEARRLYVGNWGFPGRGAIAVYAPGARDKDRPVRALGGKATLLSQPADIEFDSHGDMYISNGGWEARGVVVFRHDASGDEAPIRTINGRRTLLNGPVALAFGPGDTLYALNGSGYSTWCNGIATRPNGTVTAYAPGASGDVDPVRTFPLTGDTTGLFRGLVVDRGGTVQVWRSGGAVKYQPGTEGPTNHTMVETATPGTVATGVTTTAEGWVYEANTPSSAVCR